MSITNYWFQLIWLLTVGMVLAISLPKKQEIVMGRIEERWQIAPAVLLVVPYILAATLRSDNFGDTYAYRSVFREAPSKIAALPLYLEGIKKDKGFSVLIVIIKALIGNSPILFFMFIATVQMLCMAFIYRKYSENYWMSIFVFVAGTDYMSWCHNGIRQFLAIAIIMAGFPLLLKRKYIPLIAIILLGATFHASALLMIPIIFIVQGKAWNKKSVLCILGCILILIFVNQFTDGMNNILSNTQYSNMVADWKEWEDNGTNPIRVFVYSIPMILSIIGRKQIKEADNPVINIVTNFSILTSVIAMVSMKTSGIFIGRLISYGSMYSASILLPWEIENIFTRNSTIIIKSAIGLFQENNYRNSEFVDGTRKLFRKYMCLILTCRAIPWKEKLVFFLFGQGIFLQNGKRIHWIRKE